MGNPQVKHGGINDFPCHDWIQEGHWPVVQPHISNIRVALASSWDSQVLKACTGSTCFFGIDFPTTPSIGPLLLSHMLRTWSPYRAGPSNMASSDLSVRASHMQLPKVSYCELQWLEFRLHMSLWVCTNGQPLFNNQVDKHIESQKVPPNRSDLQTTYIPWMHGFSIQIPNHCQVRPVQRCAHTSWVGAPSSSLATSVLPRCDMRCKWAEGTSHGRATWQNHNVTKHGNIIYK